jgi:hypothetical protein
MGCCVAWAKARWAGPSREEIREGERERERGRLGWARLGCCWPTLEEVRQVVAAGRARGREYTDFFFYFLIPRNVTKYSYIYYS